MTKKRKTFDAIKLSRSWRSKVSRQIADMNTEEEMAFFNRCSAKPHRKPEAKAA